MLGKTAGQRCDDLGCARLPAKSLLTWFFLLENRREGKQLPRGGLGVCPDKTCQNKPVPFGRLSLQKMENEQSSGTFLNDCKLLFNNAFELGYHKIMENTTARLWRMILSD
ncbi:MAG: hypothetical protein UE667_08350 [Collinsella sp.]|nr:hypothetical protein [Collinsella sp.]